VYAQPHIPSRAAPTVQNIHFILAFSFSDKKTALPSWCTGSATFLVQTQCSIEFSIDNETLFLADYTHSSYS